MDLNEELELVQKVRENPQNFHVLYGIYFSKIYAYVAIRLGEQKDAEDVVADIFIKAFKNVNQFHGTSFAAWLFGIARNAINDFYRRNNRSQLDSLSEEFYAEDSSPESTVLEAEEKGNILRWIAKLSPRRREIVMLRFFGDLHNHEIAELLHIDERSVASHLSRALCDLRDQSVRERQSQNGRI